MPEVRGGKASSQAAAAGTGSECPGKRRATKYQQASGVKLRRAYLAAEADDRDPFVLLHEDDLAPRSSLTIAEVTTLGGREQRHALSGFFLRGRLVLQLLLPLRRGEHPHPSERLGVMLERKLECLSE